MIDNLIQPFFYDYMQNAMLTCSLVGAVCSFLSAFLILKGWSLIGDALSHSIVPGVAGAYIIGLPLFFGAFISGGLAATLMLYLKNTTSLKEDVIIGIIFTSFFGFGLFLISLFPMSVNVETIVLGNALAITPTDKIQLIIIASFSFMTLVLKWKEFFLVFFDETQAKSVGLNTKLLKIIFFTILSASCVAALQTVGAFLVVAMLVIPGASAYLLSNRFRILVAISLFIGTLTSFCGAYLSFFLNSNTGGIIVLLQTLIFILIFLFAPQNGYLTRNLKNAINR